MYIWQVYCSHLTTSKISLFSWEKLKTYVYINTQEINFRTAKQTQWFLFNKAIKSYSTFNIVQIFPLSYAAVNTFSRTIITVSPCCFAYRTVLWYSVFHWLASGHGKQCGGTLQTGIPSDGGQIRVTYPWLYQVLLHQVMIKVCESF